MANGADAEAKLGHVRQFTHRVLRCYWRSVQQRYETWWRLPAGGAPSDGGALSDGAGRLARQIGGAASAGGGGLSHRGDLHGAAAGANATSRAFIHMKPTVKATTESWR